MLFKKIVLIALGATVVNAHMKMIHPVPYGKASLNNSPLNAKGEDFPCKLRDDTYEVSTENMMEPGVPQTLQLAGQATHGGGSCQISLTEDRAPTKDTVWKVIQSWEGGCPANVTGNMGGDANALDPETFTFKIPHDIAAGKYTLAWTWFNRVGNREMYMNCAPVTVTGGASKREVSTVEKRATSYPPMFVANVNGCTTKEGVDIRFPQPGADPLQLGAIANLAPAGQPACEGTPKFAGAGITGSGTSSSGSSGSSGGSPVSIPSASPTTMASVAPTGAPSQSSTTYVPVPGAPVGTGLPPVPKPVTASAAAPSSSSPASSGAPTNPCSPDGVWNCIGGTSFQRCDHGKWTPPQQMAAGTQCTPGQSADLSISTVKIARRVPGMHLRKRAHGKSRHI